VTALAVCMAAYSSAEVRWITQAPPFNTTAMQDPGDRKGVRTVSLDLLSGDLADAASQKPVSQEEYQALLRREREARVATEANLKSVLAAARAKELELERDELVQMLGEQNRLLESERRHLTLQLRKVLAEQDKLRGQLKEDTVYRRSLIKEVSSLLDEREILLREVRHCGSRSPRKSRPTQPYSASPRVMKDLSPNSVLTDDTETATTAVTTPHAQPKETGKQEARMSQQEADDARVLSPMEVVPQGSLLRAESPEEDPEVQQKLDDADAAAKTALASLVARSVPLIAPSEAQIASGSRNPKETSGTKEEFISHSRPQEVFGPAGARSVSPRTRSRREVPYFAGYPRCRRGEKLNHEQQLLHQKPMQLAQTMPARALPPPLSLSPPRTRPAYNATSAAKQKQQQTLLRRQEPSQTLHAARKQQMPKEAQQPPPSGTGKEGAPPTAEQVYFRHMQGLVRRIGYSGE